MEKSWVLVGILLLQVVGLGACGVAGTNRGSGGTTTSSDSSASGGSIGTGVATSTSAATSTGGNTVSGGSSAAGGATSTAGMNTGGAIASGGAVATGGAGNTGGSTATGGFSGTGGIGTGGTGGALLCDMGTTAPWSNTTGSTDTSYDNSRCLSGGLGGASGTWCYPPDAGGQGGQECYPGNNEYCAPDGTCKHCTLSDGSTSCVTADCIDCCSGHSSNGICIKCSARNGTNKCLNADCSDCCETVGGFRRGGLGDPPVCTECFYNGDCSCSGSSYGMWCINNRCTCTADGSRCAFSDCHDCCNGFSSHGFCGHCTPNGKKCKYNQCEDCCTLSLPAIFSTCTCG